MADIKYPEAKYKVTTIGPSEEFSFDGNDGNKVTLKKYSLQLEGVAEWVTLSQKPDAPAPAVGEEIEGHIEDTGKYGYKFTKKRSGGGWSGGGKSSPGAAWANAAETASVLVIGYYQVTGTKPENPQEMLDRVKQLAPSVKAMVDEFAGTDKKDDDQKPVNAADYPAGDGSVQVPGVSEKELKW